MIYGQQTKPKAVEEVKKKMTSSAVEPAKDMRRSVSKSAIESEQSYAQADNPFGLGATTNHYAHTMHQPSQQAYPRTTSKDTKQAHDRSPLMRDHSKSRLDQSQTSSSFSQQQSHLQYSAYPKKPSMTSTVDEDSIFKSSQYMQPKDDARYTNGRFAESSVMREKSQNRQEPSYAQPQQTQDAKRKQTAAMPKSYEVSSKPSPVGYYYGGPKRDSVESVYGQMDAEAKKRKQAAVGVEADYPYFGQMGGQGSAYNNYPGNSSSLMVGHSHNNENVYGQHSRPLAASQTLHGQGVTRNKSNPRK